MIENLNDLLSFVLMAGLFVYLIYLFARSFALYRLAKHIRDEEKYYKNWEDE